MLGFYMSRFMFSNEVTRDVRIFKSLAEKLLSLEVMKSMISGIS